MKEGMTSNQRRRLKLRQNRLSVSDTHKTCLNCGETKSIIEFILRYVIAISGVRRDYLSDYCDDCSAENHKLHDLEVNKQPETIERKVQWAQENSTYAQKKDYFDQYRSENKEKIAAYRQTSEYKEKRRERKKRRRQNDPIFRLRENISNAVNKAIQNGKSSKAGQSILKYLEYTIDDLKNHIEAQFDENMTWKNYGSYWQLDHIIPQSDLLYSSMEEENFKVCWALPNLRPLEASQNSSDGASRSRHKKR